MIELAKTRVTLFLEFPLLTGFVSSTDIFLFKPHEKHTKHTSR